MVDPERVAAYERADTALLDLLKSQGDRPNMSRPVDVRFKGPKENLLRFQQSLGASWRVLQLVDLEDGTWALDIQRDQPADIASIQSLTEGAIGVELQHGLEYDGWGCVAQAGRETGS